VAQLLRLHDLLCGHLMFAPLFALAALQLPDKVQTWLLYHNALSEGVLIDTILKQARRSQQSAQEDEAGGSSASSSSRQGGKADGPGFSPRVASAPRDPSTTTTTAAAAAAAAAGPNGAGPWRGTSPGTQTTIQEMRRALAEQNAIIAKLSAAVAQQQQQGGAPAAPLVGASSGSAFTAAPPASAAAAATSSAADGGPDGFVFRGAGPIGP